VTALFDKLEGTSIIARGLEECVATGLLDGFECVPAAELAGYVAIALLDALEGIPAAALDEGAPAETDVEVGFGELPPETGVPCAGGVSPV